MENNVCGRYASALFELAKECQATESWQIQMNAVKDVFSSNPEYLAFFDHYRITKDEKKASLVSIFNGEIDRSLINFLQLLVDKKRIRNIKGIATVFNTLCNDAKGIKEGVVYSIKKLSGEQMKEIESAVSEKLGFTVALNNKLDSSLLTGIKVVVGDNVIDGSMKYRMESLKNELLRKAGD